MSVLFEPTVTTRTGMTGPNPVWPGDVPDTLGNWEILREVTPGGNDFTEVAATSAAVSGWVIAPVPDPITGFFNEVDITPPFSALDAWDSAPAFACGAENRYALFYMDDDPANPGLPYIRASVFTVSVSPANPFLTNLATYGPDRYIDFAWEVNPSFGSGTGITGYRLTDTNTSTVIYTGTATSFHYATPDLTTDHIYSLQTTFNSAYTFEGTYPSVCQVYVLAWSVALTYGFASCVAAPMAQRSRRQAGFHFSQASAATVWTIDHNLGHYPRVRAQDGSGNELTGAIAHPSINQTTLTFGTARSGEAFLR